MKILKYSVSAFFLLIGITVAANAQEKGGEKIPKPNPPVVIAGSEKKGDDKGNDNGSNDDKKGTKPRNYLTDQI